ncbi:hypothetical protein IFM89_002753 [Coptis chinensis]|uniref:Uncharacterized protein n=1 Tax=Coptis chinensis TaxID=261450 RepID=A0A835HVJ9_9MAGN|nr:hypothetical protein IFM89_002753 [Coptis chinensis]
MGHRKAALCSGNDRFSWAKWISEVPFGSMFLCLGSGMADNFIAVNLRKSRKITETRCVVCVLKWRNRSASVSWLFNDLQRAVNKVKQSMLTITKLWNVTVLPLMVEV